MGLPHNAKKNTVITLGKGSQNTIAILGATKGLDF
jgi:hypothetical protein